MARPVKFKEANKMLGGNRGHDPSIGPVAGLPAWTDGIQVASRWKLTLWERLQVAITGKVWVFIASGSTCHPLAVTGKVKMFRQATRGLVGWP